jgi:hypothetical protein
MGEAGWIHAQSMSWQHRADQMTTWYEEIVASNRVYGRCAYASL